VGKWHYLATSLELIFKRLKWKQESKKGFGLG
jgi:hypothetical protein